MPKTLFKSFLFFLLIGSINLSGQESGKNLHYGNFLYAGTEVSLFQVRDLGVSPLFYEGTLVGGGAKWQTETEKWSWELNGSFGTGLITRAELEVYAARNYTIHHDFGLWRKIGSIQEDGLGYKVGIAYQGLTNIRNTPAFRNAGVTAESFNTLLGSGEVEWLFRSNKEQRKLLWLIPLKPGYRVSKLSFRLNLPMLNTLWGPRFPYLDDFTEGTVDYEQKNELKLGGFRLHSELRYQYLLKNGNGFQFSYRWDVMKGPNDFGRIELAQHNFQAGILIRMNELKNARSKGTN